MSTAVSSETGPGTGTSHVELRSGAYADSVALLQVSRSVQGTPGVQAAQVAMATPLNVEVLTSMGFAVPDAAGPNDMVVAVRVDDEDALAGAVSAAAAVDPQECRREAARRFTPARMAEKYLRLYSRVLDRDSRITALRSVLDI